MGLAQHKLWGWGTLRWGFSSELPAPLAYHRPSGATVCGQTWDSAGGVGGWVSLGLPEPHKNLEALGFRDGKWLHQVTLQVGQTPREARRPGLSHCITSPPTAQAALPLPGVGRQVPR